MIAQLQRLHPLLGTNTTMRHGDQLTRIPELVQRLELMLYKSAHSLDEYMNPCTIERRVHGLVTLLEPASRPEPASPTTTTRLHRHRKRRAPVAPESTMITVAPAAKRHRSRRRLHDTQAQGFLVSVRDQPSSSSSSPSSPLLFALNVDLLGEVVSYLDGREILRTRSVSRFFAATSPMLVRTLRIDVGSRPQAALRGHVRALLAHCGDHLESLIITNSRNEHKRHGFTRAFQSRESTSAGAPRIWTGEDLLRELSEALAVPTRRLLPRLRRLELSAPFDCAAESGSTLRLLGALAAHHAATASSSSSSESLVVAQPLRSLVLDTTLLGDRRTVCLAELIRQHGGFFGALTELELSNNFIGEAGARALCEGLAAARGPLGLRVLNLRRNILTDGDAVALAASVQRRLPALERLELAENFIARVGFGALVDVAARRPQAPLVIGSALNCLEPEDAALIFM